MSVSIPYECDILCVADNTVRRTPMRCGWSDHPDGSRKMYRELMCDCNLHGFRERGQMVGGEWKWSDSTPHDFVAGQIRCDHKMPPKRYKALRAYLPDGRIVELS